MVVEELSRALAKARGHLNLNCKGDLFRLNTCVVNVTALGVSSPSNVINHWFIKHFKPEFVHVKYSARICPRKIIKNLGRRGGGC